jgi:hypothetical protein
MYAEACPMYVPTASHADPAGEASLLGLSYRLVCPIDNRDDKTKVHPPLICSMQERIHRTMGQRDNGVLSDGYGHNATGQLGTELGGLPAAVLGECAPPDAPSTIAPLHVGTLTRKVITSLPPAPVPLQHPYERRTSTSLNPFRRTSRRAVGINSTRAKHRRGRSSLV